MRLFDRRSDEERWADEEAAERARHFDKLVAGADLEKTREFDEIFGSADAAARAAVVGKPTPSGSEWRVLVEQAAGEGLNIAGRTQPGGSPREVHAAQRRAAHQALSELINRKVDELNEERWSQAARDRAYAQQRSEEAREKDRQQQEWAQGAYYYDHVIKDK